MNLNALRKVQSLRILPCNLCRCGRDVHGIRACALRIVKDGECNRTRAHPDVSKREVIAPLCRACAQKIHGTLDKNLRIGARDERIARHAKVQPHKLTPPKHIRERHMRRPLLHIGTKARELRRLKRLIKMHIEIHPILAEHGAEQHLRVKARILNAVLAKEIRRPCEETRHRPNIRHQFTCFSRCA